MEQEKRNKEIISLKTARDNMMVAKMRVPFWRLNKKSKIQGYINQINKCLNQMSKI